MIDSSGFRSNVGILLINDKKQAFWGRRIGQDAWQFPQGGILEDEDLEEAVFRELHEEIGLTKDDVTILARTRGFLYYRLPKRLVRMDATPICIGQKQKWFLLQLKGDERKIRFDCGEKPEFDDWQWVSYWYPFKHVVPFKREVYRRALKELAPFVFGAQERHTLEAFKSS